MQKVLFAIAVAAALMPLAAHADSMGSIHGNIRDLTTKNPVSSAIVSVASLSAVRQTHTDSRGFYAFWNLPPDRYILSVQHDGYNPRGRPVCVTAGEQQYVAVELFYALGTFSWNREFQEIRQQPDPSQTTDLYSLGACN
jgi:hypothetical protein